MKGAAMMAALLAMGAQEFTEHDRSRRTGRFDNREKRRACDHCPIRPATLFGLAMPSGDVAMLCQLHLKRAER